MLYLANQSVISCTFVCFGWSIWFPRLPSKEIRQLSARTNMVLAEPPASKKIGVPSPFSTTNLCHIIISSSHQWKPCIGHIHPYSIFDLQSAIGKSWMIMAGRVTKILSQLCAFARHRKELGRPQWHFHSPEIQQIVPRPKKKPFSEEHHLSKSWLIRLPMMIVPWNKTIFHGVSKHYSPRNWGRSDSGHGQILHHGIDLGFSPEIAGACQFSGCLKVLGGLEAKIIGGKPAKYAHPVLGNPTLEVILSNPNHDGKSLTMYIIVKLLISTDLPIHRPSTKTDEVTTRLLPPCAKRAKASLRRSP